MTIKAKQAIQSNAQRALLLWPNSAQVKRWLSIAVDMVALSQQVVGYLDGGVSAQQFQRKMFEPVELATPHTDLRAERDSRPPVGRISYVLGWNVHLTSCINPIY